jgi:hypothetical protein
MAITVENAKAIIKSIIDYTKRFNFTNNINSADELLKSNNYYGYQYLFIQQNIISCEIQNTMNDYLKKTMQNDAFNQASQGYAGLSETKNLIFQPETRNPTQRIFGFITIVRKTLKANKI